MQNYDIDMIVYPIDVSRTIGEHTLRIDSIIRNYRENTDCLDIFMVADKISKDGGIIRSRIY